jgi:hypothetical protein
MGLLFVPCAGQCLEKFAGGSRFRMVKAQDIFPDG